MAKKNLVRRMIGLGYGAPDYKGGVMFFRVGVLAHGQQADWKGMLEEIMLLVYNEFDGMKVAEMLGWKREMLSLVEFGREYSPVLYLHFDHEKHPDLAAGDERKIIRFLDSIRVEFGIMPNEWGWDTARNSLRLWWD